MLRKQLCIVGLAVALLVGTAAASAAEPPKENLEKASKPKRPAEKKPEPGAKPKPKPESKPEQKASEKPKPQPKPKPKPKKPVTPGILIDAAGLRPDSQKTYALYKGTRCLQSWRGRLGRKLNLAPGEYEIRVGFGSGWVAKNVTVKPNQVTRVPTGLFRFRDLTLPDAPSTVPQKLYHGETYLATGYQGETCRLLPGTYTVRFHAPSDTDPSTVLRDWHRVGPFPRKAAKGHDLDAAWPPEKMPNPDMGATYKLGKQTLKWARVGGAPEANVWPGGQGTAVFYLATTIEAKEARDYSLLFKSCRGGLVAWLDGKRIRQVPPDPKYRPRRIEMFFRLAKGRHVLMVKTMAAHWSSWPLRGVLTYWRMYSATVKDDGGKPPAPKQEPPVLAKGDPAPPVPHIQGIVLCQVPNRKDGSCALHYEQFRIVRRPTSARICTLMPARPDGTFRDLTSKHFASAMQPDLSYDGTKIVFTARETLKKEDKWAIYEMNVDGSGLRQVTKGLNTCLDPYYLPSGRILFSCMQDFRDEYDRDYPPLLHSCKPDGSDVDQLSFNLSSDAAAPGGARGAFIWKLSLADRADALVEAAERSTALA